MGHIGQWADLTAPDFAALDLAQAVAILPIGAVEQHGPHLPLSVDRDLTLAVLTRALPLIDPALIVLALPAKAPNIWPGRAPCRCRPTRSSASFKTSRPRSVARVFRDC